MFRSLCCVALLGLWRPACGQYTPPDIDFDKVEIWPLSGGVRDGVNVRLSAKGITPGESATIAFLTANYEVVFSMEFDSASGHIKRSSSFSGVEELRGGWPWVGDVGDMTVDFLRTPGSWDVTIDGTRMPWFDFSHQTTESVVYAAVHATLVDGEVVDTRSDCAVECHPDECLSCSDPAGKCVSYNAEFSCSNATETDTGTSCCDGNQATQVSGSLQVGDWVTVFTDTAFVALACDTFGGTGSGAQCTPAAGHKVQIKTILGGDLFAAWVPQLYAVGETDTINLPLDVLAPSVQQSKTLIASADLRTQLTVKGNRALITSATGDAATAGYAQWWFINMLYVPVAGPRDLPSWVSYSHALYASVNRQATQMYIVDEDVGHTSCSDDDGFVDKFDNNCTAYTQGVWCEDHGLATAAFKNATGEDVLSGASNADGWYATWTCCQCGGGFHADPAPTALLFQ